MSLKKNILAFFAISILGTIGHFLFEWTGENKIIGMLFPVNESTWEHLKLLFFPTIIYSVIEYINIKEKFPNYFPSILISVLMGMLYIVTLFYTINGVLGFNVDFINIVIYYVSVIATIIYKNKILNSEILCSKNAYLWSILILAIFAFLFAVWSYNPPSLGIFTPPVTK